MKPKTIQHLAYKYANEASQFWAEINYVELSLEQYGFFVELFKQAITTASEIERELELER